MKGFRFTKFTPQIDPDKNTFESLLEIFLQLVTMTGGDAAEALSWLTNLDKRYNLTNPGYGIGDFIEDLKRKGYLREEIDLPDGDGTGDGSGLSLGFNGHTDTSFTGTAEDARMVVNMEPESELKGKIVGDKVQGLGISNMKGGVAAFMMAGKALKKSQIKLKGDVILAAVVGEISRTPIGPWQTKEYRGEGAGTNTSGAGAR